MSPNAIKFSIGLVQTWVNIEMCTSILHSLNTISKPNGQAPQFPNTFIKYGRIATTCLALCFAMILVSIYIAKDATLDLDERIVFLNDKMKPLAMSLQITDFTLLTGSIVSLLVLIKKHSVY